MKKITDSVNNKLKDEDYMASMGLNKKQEPAPTPEPVAEEVQEPEPQPESEPVAEEVEPVPEREFEPEPELEFERPKLRVPLSRKEKRR